MDAKDLRTESAVSERNNDGSKYSQSGGIALHCDRNKSYQDIGSNSLGKVDVPNARPCAVIGPDRVVPPPDASEAYHIKKGVAEPWPCMDNTYRRPPEYPHKLTSFQNPTRNISPRQTFQENMQRIMVPPTYNSIKINEDTNNYAQLSDRSNGLSKNIKLNMPPEAKFCDVPYSVNPTNNEHKNVRNPEMCLPSVNPNINRTAPHGWPPGSVNLRSSRMYGAPELYQYQDYPSCAGPRPVVPRPHRTVAEEQGGYVYADPYYQEGNIRFKPYPSVKERYPQQRYEYIGNYSNPFHPPPGFPPHKYELQKSIPPHPYPPYPPIKYLDSRVADPVMEGYQRSPQGNYNIQYRNQVIHPNYGPVIGNCPQNKMHSYPPDAHMKSVPPNKLPYDANAKAYIEYDNNRPKIYPPSESYFVNEMSRMPVKSHVIMPNYPTLNMHNIPTNPYLKKDGQQIKNYDHMAHYRSIDPNLNVHNPMSRHAPVFSPNTIAISPTDSNTSNDTTQTLGTSQEDCGYVSQSSSASVRSIDSGINRIPNEYLRRYYDNRYGPIVRTPPMMTKSLNSNNNKSSKDKKQIDVRQFLQMWNEGDEEQEENASKEIIVQASSTDKNNFGKKHEAMNNQEQLYVLGLVNVPSEELAKYEHIQKVSKLPENIKGYNSIELLNQFEEVIESSNMNNYKNPQKEYHMLMKGGHQKQVTGVIPPRPVSPLDVEAKISQSVIHKEVGCNFEIKPCSPKMLNVEVAAPVQNILSERSIEKVANPVMLKSPMLNGMNENIDCDIMKRTDHHINMNENVRIPSCKMINTQFSSSSTMDNLKSSYSLQDLESNSGLCLASLPRLDNDIELNFPEVNQQFINANKGENTIMSNTIRDLPSLEVLDQTDNQMKDKFDNINRPKVEVDVDKSPCMVDSEKEFSKLSKYRKSKTSIVEPRETQIPHNVNPVRTDSVIIKNPDNIKNYEESADFSSHSLEKVITEIQQVPINLTSQGTLLSETEHSSEAVKSLNADEDKLPVEIAIDFSLNKPGILTSTHSPDTSKIVSPTDDNPFPLINRDDSSDSISLLPVLSEQNDNSAGIDNNNEHSSLDHEMESENKSEITTVVDDNVNKPEDTDIISQSNEDFEEKSYETAICVSDRVDCAEEMRIDVNSTVLESKSEIQEKELSSKVNNDNLEKDRIDRVENASNELSEESTLLDINYEVPQNHKAYPEDTCKIDTTESIISASEEEDVGEDRHLTDKLNSPVPTAIESEIVSPEVSTAKETHDTVITEQATIKNNDEEISFSANEVDYDSSDLTNLQKANSESQVFSNDDTMDHTNDRLEVDSASSLSDSDMELKDFEEEYYQNTGNISDRCNLDSPTNKDVESLNRKPVIQRRFWIKEMYSPWIQKLVMFSEGSCCNSTFENDIEDTNNVFGDSSEIINTTIDSDESHKVSSGELDTKENELEKKSYETVLADSAENVGKETTDDNVNVNSTTHVDNNIEEMVTINEAIECQDSDIIEEMSLENEPLGNEMDEIASASNLALTRDLNEKSVSTSSFECAQSGPENTSNISETDLNIDVENICKVPDTSNLKEPYDELLQKEIEDFDQQPEDNQAAESSPDFYENVKISCNKSFNKLPANEASFKKCHRLKRSLSDSALNAYNNDERSKLENEENIEFIWPFKRRKVDNDLLTQNLCNIINHNRRNSVSSFYNEDNVSICILIDNSCIIAEEENEEPEKVCYTELPVDCIAEIQNDCIKDDENMETLAENASSSQQEEVCDYSDSYVLDNEEKTLEETWVEDVGCVETVISDDIAEDIEICEASSPKDDTFSDNDESGVFSSSEHTDKVKFIYGEKMCSDDALFVETLYKTPQMDVNRTLYNREHHVSEDYDRYYDNDSLEKMLSESHEQELSPYVPQYIDSMPVDDKEPPENKENVDNEIFSHIQNKGNAVDIVVDINVDKIERENIHSIELFAKTGEEIVNSCESSIDDVFTYNQKEEDAVYTSSSPEVSSTTSEEKSSGILLKITNYKGSRISQINDISRVNKTSRCKFTEDKEYLHSHANFSANRPLLTKAAQKYIPPLKESIRDLKVKLSLPQHSLMKLKQLKISKDEPKLNKLKAVQQIPKKPKPKFEDVLKSIDEIQFKMHKEKSKKTKKSIPKVVIKKNENGSHYASTSNKDDFNPDMTGRKWQPWVFIEKNHFIDKMATKNKTKAIYSHRKRTYVLAEKFQKYKSASSAKFVISPPISDNPSSGLKYTIRLKHNY
uniref:Uncharacterized protein n=1 Tax=Heliothis virescens TaxID=7102 RepID=A0A2A4JS41_HELVI